MLLECIKTVVKPVFHVSSCNRKKKKNLKHKTPKHAEDFFFLVLITYTSGKKKNISLVLFPFSQGNLRMQTDGSLMVVESRGLSTPQKTSDNEWKPSALPCTASLLCTCNLPLTPLSICGYSCPLLRFKTDMWTYWRPKEGIIRNLNWRLPRQTCGETQPHNDT